jgi:hypothetical protein
MFYWYDADGYIDDGPSSTGLLSLIAELKGPAALELLEDDWTERLDELAAEIEAVLKGFDKAEPPADEREEVTALQEVVRRAPDILILTDGLQ